MERRQFRSARFIGLLGVRLQPPIGVSMSRNYYSEIYLHLTWHTKLSQPLLTPPVEQFVHRYLKQRLVGTPGVFVHELGGIETHVHLAITIAPTILISELVGQLKGA